MQIRKGQLTKYKGITDKLNTDADSIPERKEKIQNGNTEESGSKKILHMEGKRRLYGIPRL